MMSCTIIRTVFLNLSLQETLLAEIEDSAEKCTRLIVIGICDKLVEDKCVEKPLCRGFHEVS